MTEDIRTRLVERLREIGSAIRCGHVATVRSLVNDWKFSPDEAADEIEALDREVKRYIEAYRIASDIAMDNGERAQTLADELARLKALASQTGEV